MTESAAFYSYVRADDDHDDGYLTDLRRRLTAEVRMQTGEDFLIFQDREDIFWGQRWQATINGTIESTTFLIPIITPAFFVSSACRQEVELFLARESVLGRDDLILPIYYVQAEGLTDPSDSLAVELSARQHVDWRPLRFVSLDESAARRKLADLAGQIVAALRRVPAVPPVIVAAELEVDDDAPGFVELVAEAEDAFPLFNDVIGEFTERLTAISAIAVSTTDELQHADSTARPAAARLTILRRMAQELDGPVTAMEELAEDYVEQLARVDGGMNAIAEQVPDLQNPQDVVAATELHGKLHELAVSATEGLGQLGDFAGMIQGAGRLSSNLRPVLRRMSAATDRLAASKDTILEWERQLGRRLDDLSQLEA